MKWPLLRNDNWKSNFVAKLFVIKLCCSVCCSITWVLLNVKAINQNSSEIISRKVEITEQFWTTSKTEYLKNNNNLLFTTDWLTDIEMWVILSHSSIKFQWGQSCLSLNDTLFRWNFRYNNRMYVLNWNFTHY